MYVCMYVIFDNSKHRIKVLKHFKIRTNCKRISIKKISIVY